MAGCYFKTHALLLLLLMHAGNAYVRTLFQSPVKKYEYLESLTKLRCSMGMSCDGFEDFKAQYDYEQYYNTLHASKKFQIAEGEVNLLLSRNSGMYICI